MKYLLLISVVFLSCNPVKKAIKTFNENPEAAAQYCSEHFPVEDIRIITDTVEKIDTVVEGKFIVVPCDTVTLTATCPPTKVINRTITIHDTIIKRDQAKEITLVNTVNQRDKTIGEQAVTINRVQGEFDDMKDKRNWWRIACIITWVVMGGGIILKLKKII